jgi:hypothetical protein
MTEFKAVRVHGKTYRVGVCRPGFCAACDAWRESDRSLRFVRRVWWVLAAFVGGLFAAAWFA